MPKKTIIDLTPEEVHKYLSSSACRRVPELDISFLQAYELSDARILLEYSGEGGQLYASRQDLEDFIQSTKEYQTMNNLSPKNAINKIFANRNIVTKNIVDEYDIPNIRYPEITEQKTELDIPGILDYFSRFGFYTASLGSCQADLETMLIKQLRREYGVDCSLEQPYLDLFMLKWDEDRVWSRDAEADVCMGNEVYISMVQNLAAISRGIFDPQDIAERWETLEGPIHIKFSLDNQSYDLQTDSLNDWIDLNLIREINSILKTKKMKFEIVWTGDQTVFVTVLSRVEKKQISRERKWKFTT